MTVEKMASTLIKTIEDTNGKYLNKLNKSLYVVDLSLTTIRAMATGFTDDEHAEMMAELSKNLPLEISLNKVMEMTGEFAVLVIDPSYGQFVVASSYAQLQSRAMNHIGKIEYLPGQSNESPLTAKLKSVIARLPDSPARIEAIEALKTLYNTTTTKLEYSWERPDFNINALKNVLGTASVIVTVSGKSPVSAAQEKELIDNIVKEIETEDFLELAGSNSIMDDIREGLYQALGEPRSNGSRHAKKKPIVKKIKQTVKGKVTEVKLPQLRGKNGQYYSLTSLENLLKAMIAETVAKNMGDGGRHDILNYQTGRFAESTRIERLTQNREGLITVYYDYMKYPYATFSRGGVQERPFTRDPKRLISKSIREIAAKKVANQLRTVLV